MENGNKNHCFLVENANGYGKDSNNDLQHFC